MATAQEVIYKEPRPKKTLSTMTEDKNRLAKGDEKGAIDYAYNPRGKTDPFKSFIAEQEEVEKKKRRKPRTYLETLDLSQLDLIAIVQSKQGNWAMVRDAKGLGYVIKKGTAIGLNEGVVQDIRDKKVIVREKFRDYRGREITRDVEKEILSIE